MSESIVTSGLTKYYGSFPGLVDLDLSVAAGEVFGYLGPNGAGKTTTIRLLMGMIRPTRGRIFLLGRELHKNRLELFGEIGYLPGEIGLYKDLTGDQYLLHLIKLRKARDEQLLHRRLDDLKKIFDINYDKKIKGYSKGMRQILGIIQAFVHDPRLVVLDEPTSGLDPVMQEKFYQLIRREKEKGKTVFLSSHILGEVERVCDRAGFIKQGRLAMVERLGRQGSRAGKKVRAVVSDDPNAAVQALNRLSGIEDLAIDGDAVRFFFTGKIEELVEWAATAKVVDFICEPPSVEDFFIRLYQD